MGFFSKVGGYIGRGAAAVATGGASEAYRAATGKKDPYTAYQERLGTSIGGKVEGATGTGGSTPNPYDSETPEEKAARMRAEGDINVARDYRNQLAGQTAPPRDAVQIAPPGAVRSAHVAPVAPISAGAPIRADQVASTFDPAAQARAQELQQAYLDRVGAAERGEVPSAAEIALRRGGAAAVAGAASLAAGHKGYSGANLRNAQRVGAATMQQTTAAAAEMRANEMATARQQYGEAVTAMRGQDIGLATTGADLGLRASVANQGANLTAAGANQQAQIEAARANQAADLQRSLTQAGFDQQAIMHMSDQELSTKLANAGFKLTQEQIDDLRQHNLTQSQLEANGQVISGSQAEANRQAQIKQVRAQLAMAIQQNDQKKQDAALNMLAQLGAAYATGGASAAAPSAIQYGANGSPILD